MSGEEEIAYGFAGEWTDATGMQYLRARYYSPLIGRFVSRDSWHGYHPQPMTPNLWNYAISNPTNNTDPTGHNPIDDFIAGLVGDMEKCYERGDYQCVWNKYQIVGHGGKLLGYPLAGEHLINYLYKRGDITYAPTFAQYQFSSTKIQSKTSVKNHLPLLEADVLQEIHKLAKTGIETGFVEGNRIPLRVNPGADADLYYAFGTFSLWLETNYELSGCEILITTNREFHFFDKYDWHPDLVAGGGAKGIAGIPDEWAAKLNEMGLARNFTITGFWFDYTKIYYFPQNWLELDVLIQPISTINLGAR